MIIVKVELHSAITGRKTPLAAAILINDGTGTQKAGNYDAKFLGKRGIKKLAEKGVMDALRSSRVEGHARLSKPVWTLIKKALEGAGY
jgi:hypothetical protein